MAAKALWWSLLSTGVVGVVVFLRLNALDARLDGIDRRLGQLSQRDVPPVLVPLNDSTSAAIDRIAAVVERIDQRASAAADCRPTTSAASSGPATRAGPTATEERQELATGSQADALRQATEQASSILASGKYTPEQMREFRRMTAQAGPSQADAVFELHRKLSDAINRGLLKPELSAASGQPPPK